MRVERLVWLGLLLPNLAWAWVPSGVNWDWQDHAVEDYFLLNYGSFPASTGAVGDTRDQMLSAMTTWNNLGDDLSLVYGGSSTLAANSPDGTFVLFWANTYMGGGTLAYAGSWTFDDGASYDCDIVFLNSNDYGTISWDSTPSGPGSGRYDLQAVALHELGHCIGLGHSARSDAVMYAYYNGLRALSSDETAAIDTLYGPSCLDIDGDGWSDCAADCDDDNALIHPTAGEVCDGVDGDCDGVIDSEATIEIALVDTDKSTSQETAYGSFGNVIHVDAPTALVSTSLRMVTPAGSRLVWSVYSSKNRTGPYTLDRSEISYAASGEWQSSPAMNLPLTPDRYYNIALGSLGPSQTIWYQLRPSRDSVGPITPVGYTTGRAIGDQATDPSSDFMLEQTLVLIDVADADGDGVTAMCGDCDDSNPDLLEYVGAETCDGTDEDCDGEIDEDFATDADDDGAFDCIDPCPDDAADDGDGDGSCDSEDPCPDDAADTCEAAETDGGDNDPGLLSPCGCASTPGGMFPWLLLLTAALVRRR